MHGRDAMVEQFEHLAVVRDRECEAGIVIATIGRRHAGVREMFAMPAEPVAFVPAAQLVEVLHIESGSAADRHAESVHDQRCTRRNPVQKFAVALDLLKAIRCTHPAVGPECVGNVAHIVDLLQMAA